MQSLKQVMHTERNHLWPALTDVAATTAEAEKSESKNKRLGFISVGDDVDVYGYPKRATPYYGADLGANMTAPGSWTNLHSLHIFASLSVQLFLWTY